MMKQSMRGQRLSSEGTAGFCICLLFLAEACCVLTGCGDRIRAPAAEELALFEAAEPAGPSVDLDRIAQARIATGPYRVVPGDVLQVEMPRVLDPQSLEAAVAAGGRQTYVCRVNEEGTIVLPIVGPFPVAGKSLAQIEFAVIAEYYPKFVKTPLPIYVSVLEYKSYRVSIVGAVAKPGIYAMRHDQMSLVALLMEAGGIVQDGAAVVRIARAGPVSSIGTQGTALSGAPMVRRIPPWVWAVFEREGPSGTTGWLALEKDDGILARQWLDLGNESQRQAFLEAAAARLRWVETDGLRAQLLQLAGCLESNSQGAAVHSVLESAGWQTVGQGHFVASLHAPVEGRVLTGEWSPPAAGREATANLVLPVRGLNIPFADVALVEGDRVIVERPVQQSVTVVGLVSRPGNMPYLPDTRYTLIQAIAFAGGLDLIADPRYVSVYRLKPDGEVMSITFELVNPKSQGQLTETLALPLRPGDVVSVEHTPRTRTNVFFDRVFRISLGLYFSPEDFSKK
jgi:protein involved in polysaccharide export with SLBB domain